MGIENAKDQLFFLDDTGAFRRTTDDLFLVSQNTVITCEKNDSGQTVIDIISDKFQRACIYFAFFNGNHVWS